MPMHIPIPTFKRIPNTNCEVSEDGLVVRNCETKAVRHQTLHGNGYVSVGVVYDGQKTSRLFVHRAVALAFIDLVEGKNHVNHKDSNRINNHWQNLEWVTPGENIEHGRNYGYADRHQNRGEHHGLSKLTDSQVANIKHMKGSISGYKLGPIYGVSMGTIYDIWHGRRWGWMK